MRSRFSGPIVFVSLAFILMGAGVAVWLVFGTGGGSEGGGTAAPGAAASPVASPPPVRGRHPDGPAGEVGATQGRPRAPLPASESRRDPADATAAEAAGMKRLRALVSAAPAEALALATALDRRFPDSEAADERASLAIDALVATGDIGEARTRSENYFARFPAGRFGQHVETLTGVHPRPPPSP